MSAHIALRRAARRGRTWRGAGALLVVFAALPGVAAAYAWEWPILTPEAAPAYRVELDPEVYTRLQDPLLRDLEVFDADGQRMPAAWSGYRSVAQRAADSVAVAWFPLPEQVPPQGSALRAWLSQDARGEQVRIEVARTPAAATAAPPVRRVLIDLGSSRPSATRLELLPHDQQSWQLEVAVDASDDLDHWTPWRSGVDLYRLQHEGRELRQLRIELPGQRARYLRLQAVGEAALPALAGVQATVLATTAVAPPPLRTLELQAQPGDGAGEWVYRSPGPYPLERLRIDFAAAPWLAQAQLHSRMAADRDWQARGDQLAYRLQRDGREVASDALELTPLRDREWRLRLSPPPAQPPRLLGDYRNDGIAFIAGGRPPYTLRAGSAQARRVDAPIDGLLSRLRAAQGEAWQPVLAQLGPPQRLAGDTTAPFGAYGGRVVLWAVLIGGALGVLWMVRRLLTQNSQT